MELRSRYREGSPIELTSNYREIYPTAKPSPIYDIWYVASRKAGKRRDKPVWSWE